VYNTVSLFDIIHFPLSFEHVILEKMQVQNLKVPQRNIPEDQHPDIICSTWWYVGIFYIVIVARDEKSLKSADVDPHVVLILAI